MRSYPRLGETYSEIGVDEVIGEIKTKRSKRVKKNRMEGKKQSHYDTFRRKEAPKPGEG